jgi:hypothetical protein
MIWNCKRNNGFIVDQKKKKIKKIRKEIRQVIIKIQSRIITNSNIIKKQKQIISNQNNKIIAKNKNNKSIKH